MKLLTAFLLTIVCAMTSAQTISINDDGKVVMTDHGKTLSPEETQKWLEAYSNILEKKRLHQKAPQSLALLPDSDDDGVPDHLDNCVNINNPNQRDVDGHAFPGMTGDGYGNACDADFNQDCIVTITDVADMIPYYFTYPVTPEGQEKDLNGDGVVNAIDLGLIKRLFGRPVGPSGNAACASVTVTVNP